MKVELWMVGGSSAISTTTSQESCSCTTGGGYAACGCYEKPGAASHCGCGIFGWAPSVCSHSFYYLKIYFQGKDTGGTDRLEIRDDSREGTARILVFETGALQNFGPGQTFDDPIVFPQQGDAGHLDEAANAYFTSWQVFSYFRDTSSLSYTHSKLTVNIFSSCDCLICSDPIHTCGYAQCSRPNIDPNTGIDPRSLAGVYDTCYWSYERSNEVHLVATHCFQRDIVCEEYAHAVYDAVNSGSCTCGLGLVCGCISHVSTNPCSCRAVIEGWGMWVPYFVWSHGTPPSAANPGEMEEDSFRLVLHGIWTETNIGQKTDNLAKIWNMISVYDSRMVRQFYDDWLAHYDHRSYICGIFSDPDVGITSYCDGQNCNGMICGRNCDGCRCSCGGSECPGIGCTCAGIGCPYDNGNGCGGDGCSGGICANQCRSYGQACGGKGCANNCGGINCNCSDNCKSSSGSYQCGGYGYCSAGPKCGGSQCSSSGSCGTTKYCQKAGIGTPCGGKGCQYNNGAGCGATGGGGCTCVNYCRGASSYQCDGKTNCYNSLSTKCGYSQCSPTGVCGVYYCNKVDPSPKPCGPPKSLSCLCQSVAGCGQCAAGIYCGSYTGEHRPCGGAGNDACGCVGDSACSICAPAYRCNAIPDPYIGSCGGSKSLDCSCQGTGCSSSYCSTKTVCNNDQGQNQPCGAKVSCYSGGASLCGGTGSCNPFTSCGTGYCRNYNSSPQPCQGSGSCGSSTSYGCGGGSTCACGGPYCKLSPNSCGLGSCQSYGCKADDAYGSCSCADVCNKKAILPCGGNTPCKSNCDNSACGCSGSYCRASPCTSPCVTVPPSKPAYLVVRGSDNRIYYRLYYSTSGWGSWSVLPSGLTCDSPAAAVCYNELHIVVRGMDGGTLWHRYIDLSSGTPSPGWTKLTGSSPSAPTLASNGTVICLVVRGSDSRVYYRVYTFNPREWGMWNVLPNHLTCDGPAAAMLGNNLHAAVRGFSTTNVNVNYSLSDIIVQPNVGVVRGWVSLSGSTPSEPVLAADQPANKLYLVVRGMDSKIYWRTYDGLPADLWGAWIALSTGTTCDGPGATVADNKLHFVVRGSDGSTLWHRYYDFSTGTYCAWTKLSGSTPSPPTLTS